MKPALCAELNAIFPTEEERATCVLFFHTNFSSQPGEASLSDLRLLRQAGFKLGARNVGDGATILEHLRSIGRVFWSDCDQLDGDKVFLLQPHASAR